MNKIIAMALVLMLSASFSFSSAFSASEKPAEKKAVKLKVLLLPFLEFAPLYVAQEEGYFADYGLEVELVTMTTSTQAIPSLLQGELDVICSAVRPGLFNAMVRSGQIKITAGMFYTPSAGCSSTAIAVKKNWLENHKRGGQEKSEKRIQVGTVLQTTSHYYVEKALNSAGYSSDVLEIRNLPAPVRFEAFMKGTVDIASIAEPWLSRALQNPDVTVWLPAPEIVPNMENGVLVYGERLLRREAETGNFFMVAYLRAARLLNQGKTPRNIELLAKFTKLDQDLLNKACLPVFHDDGKINTDRLAEYQKWLLKNKWVDRVLTPEEYWDDRFVIHADQLLESSSHQ
jgi:NitT/TauT family transport system substrate-binding protein